MEQYCTPPLDGARHSFIGENPIVETNQQLYPCKLVQRVVVVNRVYGPQRLTGSGAVAYRELVFELCSETATCPKAGQCPL